MVSLKIQLSQHSLPLHHECDGKIITAKCTEGIWKNGMKSFVFTYIWESFDEDLQDINQDILSLTKSHDLETHTETFDSPG
ncbi:hypothetical protein E2320_014251 [Naja naja]|nr:hypothetical protein E2320_014251 [Naja naja]